MWQDTNVSEVLAASIFRVTSVGLESGHIRDGIQHIVETDLLDSTFH
jgi:hypothetical protein